ncbi:MAG: hypothetical protein ABIV50_15095 [Opitutus sp.]
MATSLLQNAAARRFSSAATRPSGDEQAPVGAEESGSCVQFWKNIRPARGGDLGFSVRHAPTLLAAISPLRYASSIEHVSPSE